LFISGATVYELRILKKQRFFHRFRNFFQNCHTKSEFIARLVEKEYLLHAAEALVGDFDSKIWTTILSFVERFNTSTRHVKNNSIQWFVLRGYSEIEAKQKLAVFCNVWSRIVKPKIENDKQEMERWIESRMHGMRAQNHSSKIENLLVEELSKKFLVKKQLMIKFTEKPSKFDEIKNKGRFVVDMLVNDTHLIEYYGSYWHFDIFRRKSNATLEEYSAQIKRLKFLHEISQYNIIVLWEHDFQNIETTLKTIENFISNGKEFNSIQQIDHKIYNEL